MNINPGANGRDASVRVPKIRIHSGNAFLRRSGAAAGLFVLAVLLVLIPARRAYPQDKFYTYYENGLQFAEKGDWLRAIEELNSAVSLEFEDCSKKRTYGTRFIKYFPHRELGVAYYNLGEYDNARRELELSQAYVKDKRTQEYLGRLGAGVKPEVAQAAKAPEPAPPAVRETLKEQPPVMEATPPVPPPVVEVPKKGAETEIATVPPKKSELPPPLPTGALTFEPARVTQVGSRLSLAVMPLTGKGEAEVMADLLTEKLITVLVNLRRFRVIERAVLDRLLAEQALGVSGMVDEATAVEVGKIAGADAIVIGSVTVADRYGKISARVISVETSETIVAEEADTKSTKISDMEKIAEQVAIGVYNAMPLVEGNIIALEEGEIYLDIGGNVGLRKGTRCIAFSEGEPIVHPATGEVIGKRNKKLAELVVVQVQDRMSIARFVEQEKGTVAMGDKVVVK